MGILSIQSHVATGRVGNAVVAFALQRLGVEIWPIHTVLFSNHPGRGRRRGKVRASDDLVEIVTGLEEQGVFERCEAVLGGYLGSVETGAVLLDTVSRVRARCPAALFFLDPVMGDSSKGLYVAEALVGFYRAAMADADVLSPNAFELGVLTNREITAVPDAVSAARELLGGRLKTVFVTSVETDDPRSIATLAVEAEQAFAVTTPRAPVDPKGAGDLFMALAARQLAVGGATPAAALAFAVARVWALTDASLDQAEAGDLPVVDFQSLLVEPGRTFTATAV